MAEDRSLSSGLVLELGSTCSQVVLRDGKARHSWAVFLRARELAPCIAKVAFSLPDTFKSSWVEIEQPLSDGTFESHPILAWRPFELSVEVHWKPCCVSVPDNPSVLGYDLSADGAGAVCSHRIPGRLLSQPAPSPALAAADDCSATTFALRAVSLSGETILSMPSARADLTAEQLNERALQAAPLAGGLCYTFVCAGRPVRGCLADCLLAAAASSPADGRAVELTAVVAWRVKEYYALRMVSKSSWESLTGTRVHDPPDWWAGPDDEACGAYEHREARREGDWDDSESSCSSDYDLRRGKSCAECGGPVQWRESEEEVDLEEDSICISEFRFYCHRCSVVYTLRLEEWAR